MAERVAVAVRLREESQAVVAQAVVIILVLIQLLVIQGLMAVGG